MKYKVKRMVANGMSYRAIGRDLGISSTAVSNMYNDKYDYINKAYIRKNKAIAMRLKGMKLTEIADNMKLNVCTISGYVKGIKVDVKRTIQDSKKSEVEIGIQKGYTPYQIAINTGLNINTVYFYTANLGLKSNLVSDVKKKNKELCKCLFKDGYSIDDISRITLIEEYIIENYVNGVAVYKPKYTPRAVKKLKVMKKVKKKVKATPTQIEQRDMLGKGIEAGIYSTQVKLREDRDEGRLIRVYYRGLGFEKLNIYVRVRDGVSCDEAGMRWCKKFGRSFLFAEEV